MNNRVSWLNLHRVIPWRQVRCMIWRKLGKYDFMICNKAHKQKTRIKLTIGFSKYCAQYDYIDLFYWSLRVGMRWNHQCTEIAAYNGSRNMVAWIIRTSGGTSAELLRFAAKGGQIDLFSLIKPMNLHFIVRGAIEGDQLGVLQWVEKTYPKDAPNLFRQCDIFAVITYASIPMVQFLDKFIPSGTWLEIWNTIVAQGSLELLGWIKEREYHVDMNSEDTLVLALATGSVDKVKFILHEMGAIWTEYAVEFCLGTQDEALIELIQQ